MHRWDWNIIRLLSGAVRYSIQ